MLLLAPIMNTPIVLSACGVALCLLACASTPHGPDQGAQLTSAEVDSNERVVPWPTMGSDADRFITLHMGPDGLQRCREVSPKFRFDSAIIQVQDRPELAAIASCLNHPSMRDQSIILIGRADPRGASEYNDALGMQRAVQIKAALVASGISEDRIKVMSRGAAGAVGPGQNASYGYDRRVDIVVRGVHSPE
jgi:outer membrane protein OmpA-like peptidoglycan-associated protein